MTSLQDRYILSTTIQHNNHDTRRSRDGVQSNIHN
nr:MAG TPA: hypothetical protein [Caudoviricetes sp.]